MPDKDPDMGDDLPSIVVSALSRRSMGAIVGSDMNLMITVGKLNIENDKDLMVPLVDVSIYSTPELEQKSEIEEAFSLRLSVENVAFFLEDLSADFAGVCESIAMFSKSPLKLEPQRLVYMINRIKAADANMKRIVDILEELKNLDA